MTKKMILKPLIALSRSLRRSADLLDRMTVRAFSSGDERGPLTIIHDGQEIRELDDINHEMVHGIIDMGETVAREVMVPRTDVVAIKSSSSIKEVLETAIQAGHSRIPVFEEKIDNIIGVLYSKDLLKVCLSGETVFDLTKIVRPAYFIPESKPLAVLLREFQRNQVHIAIVVDEYGGTAGLVTLEDILEEITGEIEDEYDEAEEKIVSLEDGGYLMDARLDIESVEDLLGIEIEKEEFESLGGLAISLLGRLPLQGEDFIHQGYRFIIDKATDRKVVRMKVEKAGNED
jgi:CBS domain containing-hemolysin-like protein